MMTAVDRLGQDGMATRQVVARMPWSQLQFLEKPNPPASWDDDAGHTLIVAEVKHARLAAAAREG
jgi:hypothetical protein